ncbi:hypothetical protein ACQPZA_24095 [Pseudonocardia xinjiangensis]|uniref:hypothetical protein n=1 Tax=Pseudonocardia xinjiangensis TaxID=75289 RepID=UPI003D8A2A75
MNSLPIWVPLIVAGLGVLGTVVGTLAGVLVTQRRSDRRERESWERERVRERELWVRDDMLRTFEQRRDAYADFYSSLRIAYLAVIGIGEERADGWERELERKYDKLRLYASPEVFRAADEAFTECRLLASGRGSAQEYDDLEDAFIEAVRRDIGVPRDLWSA